MLSSVMKSVFRLLFFWFKSLVSLIVEIVLFKLWLLGHHKIVNLLILAAIIILVLILLFLLRLHNLTVVNAFENLLSWFLANLKLRGTVQYLALWWYRGLTYFDLKGVLDILRLQSDGGNWMALSLIFLLLHSLLNHWLKLHECLTVVFGVPEHMLF